MKRGSMIVVLVAALLILTAPGCGASVGAATNSTSATTTSITSVTTATPTTVTADEYDVYSALFESVHSETTRPIVITPIHDDTFFFGEAVGSMERYFSDRGDVIDDFKAKNEASSVLERRFTISVPYTIISEQEMTSIFSGTTVSGWEKFYAKYPQVGAYLALSRVGFSQEKDIAVLYSEYVVGAAGGQGDVVLMKRTDGRWTVEKKSMVWLS